MRPLILLGPQRQEPTLAAAFDHLAVEGPVAAVTAGWQEREGEDEELAAHLGREVTDLRLHHRTEEIFAADRELAAAHRARQDRLREMQRLYRYRLDFALEPARELLARGGDRELLDPERRAALDALRRLDAEHRERIAAVHRDFERRLRPGRRPAVVGERRRIADVLRRSAALAIAGGHVAVLLNRLRLCGLADLLTGAAPEGGATESLAVVAWSAGAMVLGERLALFHDRPPWGAGNAELFEVGLGLYRGLLPFPDARSRLRLDDRSRLSLLARRFAPDLCLALDGGTAVARTGGTWRPLPAARRITPEGELAELAETPAP